MRIARMFLLSFALAVLLFSLAPQAHAINIWEGTSCIGPTGGPDNPCNFCDAIVVMKNIITFMFEIAIPITVGVSVWGAIKMMIAGGDPRKIQDSKKVIWAGFKGLIIVMSSWVVMNVFLLFMARGITGSGTWSWNTIQCQQ